MSNCVYQFLGPGHTLTAGNGWEGFMSVTMYKRFLCLHA